MSVILRLHCEMTVRRLVSTCWCCCLRKLEETCCFKAAICDALHTRHQTCTTQCKPVLVATTRTLRTKHYSCMHTRPASCTQKSNGIHTRLTFVCAHCYDAYSDSGHHSDAYSHLDSPSEAPLTASRPSLHNLEQSMLQLISENTTPTLNRNKHRNRSHITQNSHINRTNHNISDNHIQSNYRSD